MGRYLGPFLKTGLPLMGNVIKWLTKSVLTPLGLTAAVSVTDAAYSYKKSKWTKKRQLQIKQMNKIEGASLLGNPLTGKEAKAFS